MRAAAVQLNSTEDLDRNLETADRLTRAAAKDGAQLVVLPERWPALGPGDIVAIGAQDLDEGPAVGWARRAARELGIDLVAGGVALNGAGLGLAQAPDAETYVVAQCDRAAQQRVRDELPALRHRRAPA